MSPAAAPGPRAALLVVALACFAVLAAGPARASGGGHDAPAADPAKPAVAPAKPAPPPPPTPAAAAAPDAEQPWRLIRALHRLQARLGEGDGVAQAAHGDLVADLARRFDAAPAAVWDDRRNAAAQMLLLLSGADPRAARRRLDAGAFGGHDAPVRAGLAFAEGDAQTARRALADLDEDLLDALPRAHAALVAATLIAAGPAPGRAGAHAYFDRARLLASGFLPEEAALRRQARLAEDLGDRPRFAALAAAYLRRYAGSVYAPPFRKRLPQALAALVGGPDDLAALAPLARALAPPERGAALDAVARAALTKGQPDLAGAAAALWLDAGAEPAAQERAQIYALAAQALRGGPEVAARLAETRPADPDAEALRRAALALARQVTAWPPQPLPEAGAPPSPPAVPAAPAGAGRSASGLAASAAGGAGAGMAGQGLTGQGPTGQGLAAPSKSAQPLPAQRPAAQPQTAPMTAAPINAAPINAAPSAPDRPTPTDAAAAVATATETKILKALSDGESLLRAAPRLSQAPDPPQAGPPGAPPRPPQPGAAAPRFAPPNSAAPPSAAPLAQGPSR